MSMSLSTRGASTGCKTNDADGCFLLTITYVSFVTLRGFGNIKLHQQLYIRLLVFYIISM